jgi:ubiquinone/menaquinone biosynthesis C-methylase UbiE
MGDRPGSEPGDTGALVPRDHWQQVYGSRAEDEVSWFQARPQTSLALISAAAAGPDARIVDVGGGASRLVDALLDAGHRSVTVLDIAEGALALARRRLGPRAAAVEWITADVTTWEPGAPFDLWHDRAVFHFLTRPEDREAYRATLRRALRRGGQAIVATFSTAGPERCSGLPVVRYEPETLASELGAELRLVQSAREEHLTPGGKLQRFQYSRLVRL